MDQVELIDKKDGYFKFGTYDGWAFILRKHVILPAPPGRVINLKVKTKLPNSKQPHWIKAKGLIRSDEKMIVGQSDILKGLYKQDLTK